MGRRESSLSRRLAGGLRSYPLHRIRFTRNCCVESRDLPRALKVETFLFVDRVMRSSFYRCTSCVAPSAFASDAGNDPIHRVSSSHREWWWQRAGACGGELASMRCARPRRRRRRARVFESNAPPNHRAACARGAAEQRLAEPQAAGQQGREGLQRRLPSAPLWGGEVTAQPPRR